MIGTEVGAPIYILNKEEVATSQGIQEATRS